MSTLLIMLLACGEEKTTAETTDTGTDTTETGTTLSDFVYLTEASNGDFSCFAGETGVVGSDIADSAWNTQSVDSSLVEVISVGAEVIDFESDDPVEEAFVDVFFSNTISGEADSSGVSESDGSVTVDIQTCSPFSYRVYTDPAAEETKITIEANTVEGPGADSTEFNSVSVGTYQVIPALLGISPDVDKGIVAGTFYGCDGVASSGGQVVVRDAAGNIPESLVVKYFVDDFPHRDQEWTSEDGLWVAVNVPVGEWFVDVYVSDGAGGHIVKGTTKIVVVADSINISNIYTGFGDGVFYPDGCLTE